MLPTSCRLSALRSRQLWAARTHARSHEQGVMRVVQRPLGQRPRATCALCLVQQRASWWAHVGDSRLYHVRHGALLARSRDHSHVELLLREGLISAEQAQTHPMRNFVECCLGGDPILPGMSLARRRPLLPDDVLLACRGRLWGSLAVTENATRLRTAREAARGKQSGRTQEIQRLIGRSLRAVVDLKALGDRTITIDCDVLQADGGTRTASVTGGFVALAEACEQLVLRRLIAANPLHGQVAAVSVGIVAGVPVRDLDYAEDSQAETDMNVVMNNGGAVVEVQGTAQGHAFRRHELDALLNLAAHGIGELFALQAQALEGP